MIRALLAALLLLASPAWGADEEPTEPRRFKWMVLPNVGFDTDDGLGFGARAELQRVRPDVDPYLAGFVLQGYVSLKGYHHHRFHMDWPHLGRRGRTRLTIRLAYRQWLNDGYWGIGGGTVRERAFLGDFGKDDLRRKRYRYYLVQPFAHINLRWTMPELPVALFGSVKAQWTRVSAYEGSLLAEQRPYGMDGGFTVQLSGGFLVDTRSPEIAPESGVLFELSARLAPHWVGRHSEGEGTPPCDRKPELYSDCAAQTGSAGAYAGPFVSIRSYVGLGPGSPKRAVLATRVMAEWLFGDVPFFEMVRWGGSVPILGVGGAETVRGASFGRWRAPGRAVANAELRIDVIRHKLFKEPFRWQLVPLADLAVVWGAGDAATDAAPPLPIHPTVGVGIHVVWAEAFVGRVDFGVGPDPVREPDGRVTWAAPNWGLYIMFDQTF